MIVACTDGAVVPEVQAILQQYAVARVRAPGPNRGSPMIWVMVDSGLGEDKEGALRRAIAQISGATIRS
jgi:hypothetical protein